MIVLALDIDSTVVTHAYPAMGRDIGAIPWLKKALEQYPQIRVMLCTMRIWGQPHPGNAPGEAGIGLGLARLSPITLPRG